MHRLFISAFYCAAVAVPFAHSAEPATPSRPSATDAGALVPETRHDSAFSAYQPYRHQMLAPWREVNDQVRKVGGHIGILRGAAENASGKPAAQQPPGRHP